MWKLAAAAVAVALIASGSAAAEDTRSDPATAQAASPAAPPATLAAPPPATGEPEFPPPELITLTARPVLYVTGKSNWDDAEQRLGEAFSAIFAAVGKGNLKVSGAPMVEYLDSGDDDFQFKAMVPIEQAPKTLPSKGVKVGESPTGQVLKFVHKGSFEDLEEVYNRIDDYIVSKSKAMKKIYEEYQTDPATTSPEQMVTNIYVAVE